VRSPHRAQPARAQPARRAVGQCKRAGPRDPTGPRAALKIMKGRQPVMSWWTIAIPGAVGVLAACFIALRRRYLVIHVFGLSMFPSLRPGDRVLVRRAALGRLRAGMVVVLSSWPGTMSPGRADGRTDGRARGRSAEAGVWLIKRLAAGPGDPVPEVARAACGGTRTVPRGMAVVLSDSKTGGDSRTWGFASARQIVGYVVSPLPDPAAPKPSPATP
jgi:signal peptidase I